MSQLYKAQTRFLFHAHIKIKLSAFYDDAILDELFAELERVDKTYNSYQKGSYIDVINRNSGNFVNVEDEAVRILTDVKQLSSLFDGEYDITIMPLIRLWGFYKENEQVVPSRKEIETAKHLVNYKKIEIERNSVKIDKGQEIITGSFIKAYAIDKITDLMKKMHISDAIINAGGSTIMAINNSSHPIWKVNVREPVNDELLFVINLNNKCLSTSSQSKTFVEINGIRYGHILSATTGMPSHTRQIGIVSDNCMLGDVISTGLFNFSPNEFNEKMKELSQLYDIEGYMIDKDGEIIFSKGFQQFISD